MAGALAGKEGRGKKWVRLGVMGRLQRSRGGAAHKGRKEGTGQDKDSETDGLPMGLIQGI